MKLPSLPPPNPRHWVSNRDFLILVSWIIGFYLLITLLALVV